MKSSLLTVGTVLACILCPCASSAQTTVSTLAGNGQAGPNDGPGSNAQFNNPYGVARDGLGNTYVADAFNHLIRKISPGGAVTTIGGNGTFGYVNSTNGIAAAFNNPEKLVADAAGNIYVADTGNGSIRRIDATTGAVTTFAGSGQSGYVDGPAATARFNGPIGLAFDLATSSFYVADADNYRIRHIDATGTTTTLAGSGVRGFLDGPAATARFLEPQGIALDAQGNLYIADRAAHRVRKLSPAGVVSTYAGSGTAGYVDGPAASARFNSPIGVAVDAAGTVYVMDRDNQRVRRITLDGQVSTVAGSGQAGYADGPAATAQFNRAYDLCVSGSSLFIADANNHRIRQVTNLPLAAATARPATTGLTLANYPNPFRQQTRLVGYAPQAGFLKVEVYNAVGKRVFQANEARATAGPFDFVFDANGLAPGLYFCRLSIGPYATSRTLLLTP